MDGHSFTAGSDYRGHAATMTGFRGGSASTLMEFFAPNTTAVVGAAGENGATGSRWNVAGKVPATAETHYVKARRFNAASLPGPSCPYDFYLRVLSGSPIPERGPHHEGAPEAPRSNGWGCRVIGPATAKNDIFAITVNRSHTIGVIVSVDLERGAPAWSVIDGGGVFTGSFVISL